MKIKSRKNILYKSLVMITLIIFLASFYRVPYTKAQIETTVLGIDSADDIEARTAFVLSIYLVNVSKTTGVGLDLTWDPSVLLMQTVIVNPSAPKNTTLWSQKIDNNIGSLKFALVNTNPPDYITVIQKTPILDLKFEAIGLPGNSTILSLENVELSDEYFEVYSPDVVNDGFVSIIEPEVVNENPIADAGGPYSGKPNIAIDFDGTNSYDPDGTIEIYAWDYGDSGTGTGPKPSHTYSSTGTFTVNLTVTDGEGLTDSDTATVTVSTPPAPSPGPAFLPSPSNKPPVAEAGPDRTVYVDVAIHFSGAGSHDPDGTINAYHWFFGDGGYKSGVKVMHVYEEAGNYTVSLSVTDNNGATGTDSCTVTVHPMPVEPQTQFFDTVAANHTGYVVDALDAANTTVTVNTTDTVTITVIKYESNPHPEDPMPAAGIPKYADIYVSDPDAVEWPIYVEMFYTDEEVEGLDEYSLGIFYWFNGTWKRCSNTGVDAERNVVWAYMTAEEASGSPILMGGMPGIIVPPLPPILDNLKITPAEVELGDSVTISFDIMNIDNQSITYTVTMEIGWLTVMVDVDLEAYEAKTVSRNITRSSVGVYNVTVHGMTGSFEVKSPEPPPLPAMFGVSDLIITPEEVVEGEVVTVSVDVTNVGEMEGSYTLELVLDGFVVGSEEITSLGGGMTVTVVFELTRGVGSYTVEFDGLTGSFTVKAPPEPAGFVLSNLTITPAEVELGEEVTVSFVITNADSRPFVYVPHVQIGEITIMDDVELEGHESKVIVHIINQETAGDFEVEVDGLTGSFKVKPRWMRLGTIAVILIVIIVAAAILYENWKGILPKISHNLNSNLDDEKRANRRKKV